MVVGVLLFSGFRLAHLVFGVEFVDGQFRLALFVSLAPVLRRVVL